MGWGKEWPVFDINKVELIDIKKIPRLTPEGVAIAKEQSGNTDFNVRWDVLNLVEQCKADIDVITGIDLGAGDSQTILTTFENGEFKQRIIPEHELYNNLKPTHDPYTNPNAHIYYECACGEILDPQTKSFAALNNYASRMGWKIRFGEKGYTPYCVKCGEGVE